MKVDVKIRMFLMLLLWTGSAQAGSDGLAHLLREVSGLTGARRIEAVSARLLGRPYVGGALGEGPQGVYDLDPMIRLDAFDCTTYVETVMAIASARGADEAIEALRRIRYRRGNPTFVSRNHFTDLDWIPNNRKAGYLEDVTEEAAGAGNARVASAVVSKRSWYSKLTLESIQRRDLSGAEGEALLARLRAEGARFKDREARVPYLPLSLLFPRAAQNPPDLTPDPGVLHRLGAYSGAVLSVVRPDWDLSQAIGTRMNVSHQGFLVLNPGDGVLYFRNASSSKATMSVVDVPLVEYFKGYAANAAGTVKGFNLQRVRSAD